MEVMIARWIRETIIEYEIAKKNLNFFRMNEMHLLETALRRMRDKLLESNKIN
jgi:hypothetical protein